jgi:archaellum component FlaC
MHALKYLFIVIPLIFYNGQASSQSIEGLKDIVSYQQEKISRIEDNLKNLIGLIEEQSNQNNKNNK